MKPVRLGAVLQSLVKDLGLEKRVNRARLFTEWEKWVGESIAKNTEPVKFEHGRLLIRVKSDAWRTELIYQRQRLRETLNEKLGEALIDEIKFI